MISLDNYPGTEVSNETLCWVVNVVVKEDGKQQVILVAAAAEETEAKQKVGDKQLDELVAAHVVVEMLQVRRGGRKGFPMSPAWAMTLYKVQGATLEEAVLHFEGKVDTHSVYMEISRVREIDKL